MPADNPSMAAINEILEHLRAENAQDLDALLEGMTDDCYNDIVGDPNSPYVGPERVGARYKNLWASFPDMRIEVRRLITVDPDRYLAVSQNHLTGTQEGPLFGIPGTGKQVSVPAIVVWEFGEGYQLKGEHVTLDFLTMVQQVGYLEFPEVT